MPFEQQLSFPIIGGSQYPRIAVFIPYQGAHSPIIGRRMRCQALQQNPIHRERVKDPVGFSGCRTVYQEAYSIGMLYRSFLVSGTDCAAAK